MARLNDLNLKLEEKKSEVVSFERKMDTKIMTLNNDIATLTVECDKVESEKATLQNDEEETSAKKVGLESELTQVIFSIEMIEQLCSTKTEHHTTTLPYSGLSISNKNFTDGYAACEENSLK